MGSFGRKALFLIKLFPVQITSKLPQVGTTIFTVMSNLARNHGAINLSQGFPNFDCSPRLKALVQHHMEQGANQYAPMPGSPELRTAIIDKVERLYGWRPNADTEITITAGATQALFTAITAFVHPGDEVILLEPAYDSYGPAVELCGGKVVPYQLRAPDYRVDWEAFRQLVSPRTRMIVINTPHNPTGSLLEREDLEQLQALTRGTDILVLSDEVYEHLIYDGAEHQSILRYPELWQRSMATYSFGKTFHNTGWKLGYCLGPEPLMREFRRVHQFNVFSVHHPTQRAVADFLQTPEEYLSLGNFYQRKRDHFLRSMEGSRFQPLACGGTYFQLFDYSAISQEKDTDFAVWLTEEHGVATIPVSPFYSAAEPEAKVVRMCFAKTEEVLEAAGEVLRGV
ncbi:MAG: methionine aminotransferase [Bacteroidota bacterium]